MTKNQFFRHCKEHMPWGSPRGSSGPRISLQDIWVSRAMHNSQVEDDALYLHGFWAEGGPQAIVLYRPRPDTRSRVKRKLELAQVKFQRWLDEFFDAERFVAQLRGSGSLLDNTEFGTVPGLPSKEK